MNEIETIQYTKEQIGYGLVILVGIVFLIFFICAVDAPPAYDARDQLRRLYQPTPITLITEKSANLALSCGTYRIGNDKVSWKFLDNQNGLWAAERSQAWKSSTFPSRVYDSIEIPWESCINHQARGSFLSSLVSPLLVAFLNAT